MVWLLLWSQMAVLTTVSHPNIIQVSGVLVMVCV
jgi:hypothetical protein